MTIYLAENEPVFPVLTCLQSNVIEQRHYNVSTKATYTYRRQETTAIQQGKYKDDILISVLVEDLLFHGLSTRALMYLNDNFPQLGVENTTSLNENGTITWFNMNTGKFDKSK